MQHRCYMCQTTRAPHLRIHSVVNATRRTPQCAWIERKQRRTIRNAQAQKTDNNQKPRYTGTRAQQDPPRPNLDPTSVPQLPGQHLSSAMSVQDEE